MQNSGIELDQKDECMIIGSKRKVKITGEGYETWVQKVDPDVNPKDVYG